MPKTSKRRPLEGIRRKDGNCPLRRVPGVSHRFYSASASFPLCLSRMPPLLRNTLTALLKMKLDNTNLLAQLIERCTGIADDVIWFEFRASLIFFRLSFHNCKSCVYNCDDLLSIYFIFPQFKYMIFIYSYFHHFIFENPLVENNLTASVIS